MTSSTKASASALTRLRSRIERTDDALLALLVRRAGLARAIGRAKQRAGLPVLDPAREATVVRRAGTRARELGMPQEDVRVLFWGIIALCRAEQLPARAVGAPASKGIRGASRGGR